MTHREAARSRLPHVPASECPGELRPRRLRRHDTALKCARCGVTLWRDAGGVLVNVAYNGTPIAAAPVVDSGRGE